MHVCWGKEAGEVEPGNLYFESGGGSAEPSQLGTLGQILST